MNPGFARRPEIEMIRPVLTELALFLTPFVLYALFLWLTRGGVLDRVNWSLGRTRLAADRGVRADDRKLHPARGMGRRPAGLDI